ncbi:extracellular matrix protein 2 [Limanda limanda]|uniref:extracellular matrix protein 2 n=1 Tax=Limanda limanda TaxID=27771 RepID=UPI0029C85089|nr:extracellular matrix protein 2 [Limanda limanda]
MRWWLVVASLWLLVALTVPDTQARNIRKDGKRKRSGHGHGGARAGSSRTVKIRLVPGPIVPVEPGHNQGHTLFLQPYRNIQEQHSSYNVIPGKQGQCVYQGLTMFDQAVWSPKPCVTCLCTGGRVVCDETPCPTMHCHFPYTPAGECCPVCMEPDPDLSLDLSGDSPVPSDPSVPVTPLTQEEIRRIIWREEEEHREEEERLRKKDEARKKRRKLRKEQEDKQRKIVEERRRKEQEALRLQVEKEEAEWRRQIEEMKRQEDERRRLEEEDRKQKEAAEREAREKERKLEEKRRRQEEILREELLALAEEEEEEHQEEADEEVWLRGDVFQMLPKEPEEPEEPEEPDLIPAPIPRPPAATEEELYEVEAVEEEREEELEEREVEVEPNRGGLPPGCDISDVTVTCENAKLFHFPPLSIRELKSLSLEGNNISSIPAGAFNGIPNLEWINLKKNKLTSASIDARAFKGLKMLSRLYLDGNLLEAVPSALPPSLQELKISENKLRRIDENSFRDMSNLVILELEGNLLSEGNVDPLGFTPLVQLSYLRLGRNHFRTIPQGLPASLLELYLENNLIEEISDSVLNQTRSLNVISLRHNRLDETRIAPMAWINHRSIESIDLSNNQLYLVPSYLPRSLVHLVLVGNNIERIPGYVFAHMDPGLEYLYLSYNKLDGEGIEAESFFGSYHSMVELCLDHNQLMAVPSGINEMTNVHFIRLNNNRIRSIPEESICDPNHSGDSTLVALRLENNFIDPQKVSPSAFSCVCASSSVVLKPQQTERRSPHKPKH